MEFYEINTLFGTFLTILNFH